MKISLRQLEVFDAVATLGSLTAAADRIGTSPSAASSALADLQMVIGKPLFAHSKGRALQITSEGRRLHPIVRSLLSGVQGIGTDEGPLRGVLVIGTTAMIAETMLPALCVEFQRLNPEVQISIEAGTESDLFERMSRLEFEIALIENFPQVPHIELIKWRTDELYLVVRADHPLAHRTELRIKDLEGHAWYMRDHSSAVASRLRYLLHEELGQLPISIQATSNSAVRLAALAGGGIACLSETMIRPHIQSGRLIRLDVADFRFTRVLSLARPRALWRNRINKAFDSFLLERCNPDGPAFPQAYDDYERSTKMVLKGND